jgi:hypothetical protein
MIARRFLFASQISRQADDRFIEQGLLRLTRSDEWLCNPVTSIRPKGGICNEWF